MQNNLNHIQHLRIVGCGRSVGKDYGDTTNKYTEKIWASNVVRRVIKNKTRGNDLIGIYALLTLQPWAEKSCRIWRISRLFVSVSLSKMKENNYCCNSRTQLENLEHCFSRFFNSNVRTELSLKCSLLNYTGKESLMQSLMRYELHKL